MDFLHHKKLRLNKNDYLICNQSQRSITLCQNGLLTHMHFYLTFTFAFFFPFFSFSLYLFYSSFYTTPYSFSFTWRTNQLWLQNFSRGLHLLLHVLCKFILYFNMQANIKSKKKVAMLPKSHPLVLDTMLLIIKRNWTSSVLLLLNLRVKAPLKLCVSMNWLEVARPKPTNAGRILSNSVRYWFDWRRHEQSSSWYLQCVSKLGNHHGKLANISFISWYEGNPCNMHLLDLAGEVKKGVRDAGLIGYRFNTVGVSDGISMGTRGMSYSLQSRDLIADSIETVRYPFFLQNEE